MDNNRTGSGQDTDTTEAPSAAVILTQHNKGRTDRELGEKIAQVVRAVLELEAKGSVTLTLTFEPPKGGDSRAVVVTDKITAKIPRASGGSIFYASSTGHLTRTDPDQDTLL